MTKYIEMTQETETIKYIQEPLQLALISENITEDDVTSSAPGSERPLIRTYMTIISCNPSVAAQLVTVWRQGRYVNKLIEGPETRIYVKVDDPKKCKCIARGKIEPIIRKPDGDTTTPGRENIFRMLYFKRADGIYRNALGQAIKDDHGHDFGGKSVLLKDLVRVVGPKLGNSSRIRVSGQTNRLLVEMMEYPAEFVGS